MSVIRAQASAHKLKIAQRPLITSGNENVDVLQVEFGPEWDFPGARYFASFFIDDPEKTIDIELDAKHSCTIPKQMLAQEQTFHFGVWAQADGQKIKTSDIKDYDVKEGIHGTGNAGETINQKELSELNQRLENRLEGI